MAATYEPIATATTTGGQSSVSFNSFSGYTDLFVVINLRAGYSSGTPNLGLQFNSSNSGYSRTFIRGTGSAANSFRQTSLDAAYLDAAASVSDLILVNIMNYSNTSTYKTVLTRANNAANGVDAGVLLWQNTAAITTLDFFGSGTTFNAGCIFTLYGIKAA